MSSQKRKNSPTGKSIINYITIGLSLFNIIPNIINVIETEAKDIKKNAEVLVLLYLVAIVIMLSVWFSLLAIGIVFMLSVGFTLLKALTITFATNVFLLIILSMCISKAKSNLFFKKTRMIIASIFS